MTHKMTCWNPFEDLFWGLKQHGCGYEDKAKTTAWAPLVDISEDNENVRIHAELPGMTQKDVKLSVKDGVLTIQGERNFKDEQKEKNYYRIERSYGTFARSFTLPKLVDAENINAAMKNGVLEVTVPKKEEAKAKEIEIKVQ